jgi:hypothetical protein
MATTINKYNQTTKLIMGDIDLNTSTLKLALVTSAYVFNATHTAFDGAGNDSTDPAFCEVVTGTGYTTGGATLATPTLTSAAGVCTFDAADITLTALTKTFRGAVIYAIGTFETIVNPVLFYILFNDAPADVVVNGIDFTIRWNSNGILVI